MENLIVMGTMEAMLGEDLWEEEGGHLEVELGEEEDLLEEWEEEDLEGVEERLEEQCEEIR